jgi:hypothetical protein
MTKTERNRGAPHRVVNSFLKRLPLEAHMVSLQTLSPAGDPLGQEEIRGRTLRGIGGLSDYQIIMIS